MAVVLILAVLWAIVLGPPLVRRVMERRSNESIDSFHHSLHLLERTGPKIVEPAYRLDAATAGGLPVAATVPAGGRPNLVLLKAVGDAAGTVDAVVDQASGECYERLGAPPELLEADAARPSLAERAGEYRRQRNRRRRREIVAGLAGTALITGLAGIGHGLHLLWVLTGLTAVALGAYGLLYRYARTVDRPATGRRPAPDRRRRPAAPAQRPWHDERDEDPVYEQPVAEHVASPDYWERRRAAVAGFPGAWDDLDDDEAVASWDPNVVIMNPAAEALEDDPLAGYEEELEERYGVHLHRRRAAYR